MNGRSVSRLVSTGQSGDTFHATRPAYFLARRRHSAEDRFQRPDSEPRTALANKACAVNVYFVTHATHAQETLVGANLRRDPRVEKVAFISKAQALAQMQKRL